MWGVGVNVGQVFRLKTNPIRQLEKSCGGFFLNEGLQHKRKYRKSQSTKADTGI